MQNEDAVNKGSFINNIIGCLEEFLIVQPKHRAGHHSALEKNRLREIHVCLRMTNGLGIHFRN